MKENEVFEGASNKTTAECNTRKIYKDHYGTYPYTSVIWKNVEGTPKPYSKNEGTKCPPCPRVQGNYPVPNQGTTATTQAGCCCARYSASNFWGTWRNPQKNNEESQVQIFTSDKCAKLPRLALNAEWECTFDCNDICLPKPPEVETQDYCLSHTSC